MKVFQLICPMLLFAQLVLGQTTEQRIKHVIDSFYQSHPKSVGIMIDVESSDKHLSYNYAVGFADTTKRTAIDVDQPALTASNTKTFVSAAILKLVEKRELDLEDAIADVIDVKTNDLLINAGYKTKEIKIWHLLSHTSGIADFVNDDYFKFVDSNKTYQWTRDEQIKLATRIGKPLSVPGDTFKYADINYLLASEILEHVTNKPFYEAIEDLLSFQKNNLYNTWFMNLQKKPIRIKPLVHQYYDKFTWDSYDLNPSWDLFGGGGIASTTKDLAHFFQLLFEGHIIKDSSVLSRMSSTITTKSNYCLGIRKVVIDGFVGYYHGGWWGTDAIYFPELKLALSIFILERSEKEISSEICKLIVNIIRSK